MRDNNQYLSLKHTMQVLENARFQFHIKTRHELGVDRAHYEEKVRAFLRSELDTLPLQKLHRNKELTATDAMEELRLHGSPYRDIATTLEALFGDERAEADFTALDDVRRRACGPEGGRQRSA